jgi:hypothetical protein
MVREPLQGFAAQVRYVDIGIVVVDCRESDPIATLGVAGCVLDG